MKDWFKSATLIEEANVEVGFLLFPNFYYGPDRYPDIAERKEAEPLSIPAFPRSAERLPTTSEAEPYVDELARYYIDVVRLSRKYGKSFDQVVNTSGSVWRFATKPKASRFHFPGTTA